MDTLPPQKEIMRTAWGARGETSEYTIPYIQPIVNDKCHLPSSNSHGNKKSLKFQAFVKKD